MKGFIFLIITIFSLSASAQGRPKRHGHALQAKAAGDSLIMPVIERLPGDTAQMVIDTASGRVITFHMRDGSIRKVWSGKVKRKFKPKGKNQ